MYLYPKNPVVFCHGLFGFDSITAGPVELDYWRGLKEVLQSIGVDNFITRVRATSDPIERAQELLEQISKVYAGKEIHLVGHSMGGLDCRYLTTHLARGKFSVLSITTISTPHLGTPFADYVLEKAGQAVLSRVLFMMKILPTGVGDGKGFESLTAKSMKNFNEKTPDVEGVKYFSYGGEYVPCLINIWKFPHSVVSKKEGPNDGVVSVKSAHWGTYLGTIERVNHMDLVGWIGPARYKLAKLTKKIKFKPATLYLEIMNNLAKAEQGLK